MTIPNRIARVEHALQSTSELHERGVTARAIAALVGEGALVRVARGWFVDAQVWKSWFPASRHLAAVIATHRNAVTPPLFSHHSAAALLGLPLWRVSTERVHTVSFQTTRSNPTVQRHQMEIDPADTGTVAGIQCTNPIRTVYDLARLAPLETTLGCADAALARRARVGRRVDTAAWDAWRADLARHVTAAGGRTHGLRTVRRIIELADPRAESVLESVSRLQLTRLGFDINTQVPVASPSGGFYYMDFELLGLRTFGECDGDSKYTDPRLLDGRSPAEAVVREKKRDNWVAGRTNYRMAHWGARNVGTADELARLLRSYHVPIPGGK